MEMEGAGEKQSNIRTFEDLDVWKVCRELRTQIATIARTFPKEEQYRLRDQLIRASWSVTANLAEGYGRFHYAENMQFARQARGSLSEFIVTTQVDRQKASAFSLNPWGVTDVYQTQERHHAVHV